MSWINSRQFTISNRNGRHYVFRRNNAGNTEINIPLNITTKGQAVTWLKAHPNKVANPTRYKGKRGAGLKPFERMVNGKKMIAFGNKEGKVTYRPAPGKEPNFFLNINRELKGKLLPDKWTCESLKRGTAKTSLKVVGKGRQGIVFLASRYSNGRYPFAIKVAPRDLRSGPQPAEIEFKIQNAVMEVAPEGVVRVRQILRCTDFVQPSQIDMENVQNSVIYDKSKQTIITMEYAPNGSLKKWFETSSPKDSAIRKVISQILETLKKIKDVYPYFSHNDLHLENIFMSVRGPLIGDFGWARLKKDGTNPAVNKANGTQTSNLWGIGPKTDPRYDQHLILNEIRDWIMRHGGSAKYPETVRFLNRAVPVGYRGSKDTHVSEWRLKYADPCTDLPSLASLVRTSPPAAPPLQPRRNVARSPPKKYTNAQLLALPAANFLKLSPGSKARLKTLRAAAGPLSVRTTKPVRKSPAPVANKKKSSVHKPIPRAVLKSTKFNKMVTKVWNAQNKKANETFNNAWNRARRVVLNKIQARINANKPPFTPSPVRSLPPPLSPIGPKPKSKTPSPPKKVPNFRLSPSSGRAKIQSKNSGRWVYANLQTMNYLKNLAALMNVNVKGIRSKAEISKKIFGR